MAEQQTLSTLETAPPATAAGTTGILGTPAIGRPAKPAPQAKKVHKADKTGFYWGTGRRKTAVARVRIKPGSGKMAINKRTIDSYFTEVRDRADIVSPLKFTKTEGALDVFVNVQGGGISGQAGACKLGISRALMGYDPTLEPILRENDLLTRDAREVERKKYGQSGARRRFQFSKR